MTIGTWIQEQKSNAVDWFFNLPDKAQARIFALSLTIFITLASVILAFPLARAGIITDNSAAFIAKSQCIQAGYYDTEYTNDGYYCVGIRDGNTITVRVEDLGE